MAKVDCIKDIVTELGGDANECDTTAETLRVLVALLANVDVSEIPLGDTCEMLELLKEYVGNIAKVKVDYTSFKGVADKTLKIITAEMLDGVTTIGYYAFGQCDQITSVVIPDSVVTINNQAFSGCRAMTEVTIGRGVTTIGFDAFASCDSLATVRMMPPVPPELVTDDTFPAVTYFEIIVPKGSLEAYQTANRWSVFADRMVEADE